MNCHARRCAQKHLPGKMFCDVHWFFLPQTYKIKLCNSYGTINWQRTLKSCERQLFLIDSGLRDVRRP